MHGTTRAAAFAGTALLLTLLCGCARPGPPKPPSLHIPDAVTDLSARRSGDAVDLRFTAPRRASDGVPLPAGDLRGVLCRQLGTPPSGSCSAVAGVEAHVAAATQQVVTVQDALPSELTVGPPRLLSYRVEFFNRSGRSIGRSDPAYTVAGSAPPPVAGLAAAGARSGIVLTWRPEGSAGDEVLLERNAPAEAASPTPPRPHAVTVPHRSSKRALATPEPTVSPGVTWLQANAVAGIGSSLDPTVDPDTPYRYRALRRRYVQLGGRKLELRSAPSAPVEITLQQTYPPATPTGLNVAGYFEHPGQAQPGFAVDLVWQPVDDDSRTATLAGYNIYRETLDAQGNVLTPRTRLNPTPALLPSFHDNLARPADRNRYSVTAIDTQGNESSAATKVLEPQTTF